jgi:hypothetical protein
MDNQAAIPPVVNPERNGFMLQTLLNTPDNAMLTLKTLRLEGWGRTLVFEGIVDGGAAFELAFEDCRESKWRIYAHLEAAVGFDTPVVDFAPGRDLHRSPAHLLTAHFGLSVVYGGLRVQMKSG